MTMKGPVKAIPNTITSMNLISGAVGVIVCMNGDIRTAFLLMLAAAAFDFFDGMAARALGAYSEIGKELDSLSDMVSFGLLPAVMMYKTMAAAGNDSWLCCIPLVLTVFSALRLAKFNTDERQHDGFIGLATPSAAMICASLCHNAAGDPAGLAARLCGTAWFLPVLAAALAALLVCEIPMFSMKFGNGGKSGKKTRALRVVFVCVAAAAAAASAIAGFEWSLAVFLTFAGYIIVNIAAAMF